jgi:hypothetical protein
MYQVPNYTQTVSMRLSEVLADIGAEEEKNIFSDNINRKFG